MQGKGQNLDLNRLRTEFLRLSDGIEALNALSVMIPDTVEQETTVSADQICALLKCVSHRLSESHQELQYILQDVDKWCISVGRE